MRHDDREWRRVWAEMPDGKLEETLRDYLWLAVKTPNQHAGRIAQLTDECDRRGKPEIAERARAAVGRGGS